MLALYKDIDRLHNLFKSWITHGTPKSYWLPGIFFPQGFLTGTLQVHARKYDLPIDELSFDFHVLKIYRDQQIYQDQLKTLEYGQEHEMDKSVCIKFTTFTNDALLTALI